MSTPPMSPARAFRFAVNVLPRTGILDPQGRAVEGSLPHLGVTGVTDVRVGRRVELSVDAPTEADARATVEHLAAELLSNPLIESFAIELVEASSSTRSLDTSDPDGLPGSTGRADEVPA